MPHIHTDPNQHDITVSAYIVLEQDNLYKCLVHFHRKIEKLMQIGGHIELDETPWQSIAHELEEESGFGLDELSVLQYDEGSPKQSHNINHPTPFSMNTHNVGGDHYHSDLCYGFIASKLPSQAVKEGESSDLRWLTIDELKNAASSGDALPDVYDIYLYLLSQLDKLNRVQAQGYSLKKPLNQGVVYKRGQVR